MEHDTISNFLNHQQILRVMITSSITFFLFSYHILTLLYSLSCVAQVFSKYRLSFKLSKCDFFKDRVEYVRHDLTAKENCLGVSKLFLLQDWPLQPHGLSLLSFIGLCFFTTGIAPGSK